MSLVIGYWVVGTANGELQTANGERRTANGELQTANGERQIKRRPQGKLARFFNALQPIMERKLP